MPKTVSDILQMKSKEKITVLTGYDSTMTTLCDNVDVILVGDSAGINGLLKPENLLTPLSHELHGVGVVS